VLAFVVTPVLLLIGIVGQVILGIVLFLAIAMSLRLRLKQMDVLAEEFRRSGPDERRDEGGQALRSGELGARAVTA
jgi:hypothetical protein